jgi:hypothetical protein
MEILLDKYDFDFFNNYSKNIYFIEEKAKNKALQISPTHLFFNEFSTEDIKIKLKCIGDEKKVDYVKYIDVTNEKDSEIFMTNLVYLNYENNLLLNPKFNLLINLEILHFNINLFERLTITNYSPNLKTLIIGNYCSYKDLVNIKINNLPIGLEKIIIYHGGWWGNVHFNLKKFKGSKVINGTFRNRSFLIEKVKDYFTVIKLPWGCKVYLVDEFNEYLDII